MPSRSRRAAAEISRYKSLWEQSERECRMWRNRYLEETGQRSLMAALCCDKVVLTRAQIVFMLREPEEVQPGVNVHDRLHMLAAYMLEHRLDGLTQEQIEEVLSNGNT